MRGSLSLRSSASALLGIIPAHAGLTIEVTYNDGQNEDHPRACGAHVELAEGIVVEAGSSPRMRGSHSNLHQISTHLGIIPAHAGLTFFFRSARTCNRDHPRACGAHATATTGVKAVEGSSPRMRGSPTQHQSLREVSGIIPAHAGLTLVEDGKNRTLWDHPRACGAHAFCIANVNAGKGSSPRMRGSRCPCLACPLDVGIIPAHAGLTRSTTSTTSTMRDHPRACGAHLHAFE